MHTRDFPHPFVPAFDLPTVERGGGNGAVGADGASYREIIDVADWDRSVVTNVPGTVGTARKPVLRQPAAALGPGEYFPLVYTRGASIARPRTSSL